MAKSKKEKKRVTVSIKKLKTNYELRYDYSPLITEYIKSLPAEHRGVRVDQIIKPNGEKKEDWVRLVRDVQIGNVISFFIDNSIEFKLENITPAELNEIRNEYKQKQARIREILRLKDEAIEDDGVEYDFMNIQPYPYQRKAVKFFETSNGICLLGDEPGVGKSLPPIVYATKHNLKTLVICPSALKLMWQSEVSKFTNKKAHVFKRKKKNNPTKEESSFHVINYESLSSFLKLKYKFKCENNKLNHQTKRMEPCKGVFYDTVKTMKECPLCGSKKAMKGKISGVEKFEYAGETIDPKDYDMVVVDECHRMKNLTTDWTQIIRRAFEEVPKKILLSGTAIKNRPIELFSLLNFLDPKSWNDRHQFGKTFCAAYEDNFGWIYDGVSNTEQLFERISPLYLRRLKKDVLSHLPDKTYTDIRLELTPQEIKEYNKLEELAKDDEGKEIKKSFLEKVHQLKAFTENLKLERAKEFIDDIIDSGDKVVLFFDYIKTAAKIKDFFGDRVVLHHGSQSMNENHEAVQQFMNNRKVNVFAGTIMSAGVGLTLTAANKLMFIGQAWTPADMIQCEDRIHRAITKHDNIQIITYLCEDTIDLYINEFLKQKLQVVSKVLDNRDSVKKVESYGENLLEELYKKLTKKSD